MIYQIKGSTSPYTNRWLPDAFVQNNAGLKRFEDNEKTVYKRDVWAFRF